MVTHVVPNGLAAMLAVEDATWNEVWGRIENASKNGMAVEFTFNVTDYAYDPDSQMVTVGGLTVDEGEVRVPLDDFARVMGPFLRGGPE